MAVKVKPDNAGVIVLSLIVLSIDGGGVMPLQFLQVLQDRVGLPIRFRKISTSPWVPVPVSVSDRTDDSTDDFLGGLHQRVVS